MSECESTTNNRAILKRIATRLNCQVPQIAEAIDGVQARIDRALAGIERLERTRAADFGKLP